MKTGISLFVAAAGVILTLSSAFADRLRVANPKRQWSNPGNWTRAAP